MTVSRPNAQDPTNSDSSIESIGMTLLRRLAARLRPSADAEELRRISVYEASQRQICATAGARFAPPDYHKLVALAPSLLDGHLPVRGFRHLGESVEWYIVADDQPRPAIEEMSFQHLHHLASLREDLLMYLALPTGWSFVVLADAVRTWTAHSPSAQIAAEVGAFLSAEDPTGSLEAIKDVLDECFPDIEAAQVLSRSIGTYLKGEAGPDSLLPMLREIASIVRGTTGDGRVT